MLKYIILVLTMTMMIQCQESLTLISMNNLQYYEQAFKCLLSQKAIKEAPLQVLEIGRDYYWVGLTPAELFKVYPQQSHVALLLSQIKDHSRTSRHFFERSANQNSLDYS